MTRGGGGDLERQVPCTSTNVLLSVHKVAGGRSHHRVTRNHVYDINDATNPRILLISGLFHRNSVACSARSGWCLAHARTSTCTGRPTDNCEHLNCSGLALIQSCLEFSEHFKSHITSRTRTCILHKNETIPSHI